MEGNDLFSYAVDIAAARITVPPLPTREELTAAALGEPVTAPDAVGKTVDDVLPPSGPGSRIDAWKRELLDITTRNSLISMRAGVRTLPLLVTDGARLEDAFSAEKPFRILPKPDGWNG